MTTYRRDDEVFFGAISYAHSSVLSLTGAASFPPFSITASFIPLTTLNPAETNAANIARFLATKLMYEMRKKA